ncbi:sugar MFS transporter [Actinotalea sp. K2]|uniref:MFS transporter n=1 Tax=Actinotalea sp. K2 TaxID=2939438 RepID=UPI002017AE6E|nr:MFS transporter [Actinotalea sp. K2]MCL3861539.1 MFS transporter [Actinotalea sp. K2]
MTSAPGRLPRDRITLTLYATFITWGWFLYGFSPAVPLIALEQGISRAAAGLHGTAMALGTVATGLISSRLALRFGRRNTALIGITLVVLGVSLLMTGYVLAITLPACFVIALGGSLMISAAQPALSVHGGAAGTAVVTEANGVGAAFGLLAPLALGASVGLGWGWRPAVALVILLALVTGALLSRLTSTGALGRGVAARRVSAVEGEVAGGSRRSSAFSGTFWLFWGGLLCGVAIENATTFWASDLLITRTGASPSVGTAAISALVAGMCVSRFVVGPLSMRKAPEKLLIVAFVVAGAGWAVFWLATVPWVAVVGLVLAGLGYGAHYPLSVALTMRASDGRPDQAQARASLGVGGAVAIAPFALGALADQFGAHTAFLLVPVLIAIGGACVALGLRSVHRSTDREPGHDGEPAPLARPTVAERPSGH